MGRGGGWGESVGEVTKYSEAVNPRQPLGYQGLEVMGMQQRKSRCFNSKNKRKQKWCNIPRHGGVKKQNARTLRILGAKGVTCRERDKAALRSRITEVDCDSKAHRPEITLEKRKNHQDRKGRKKKRHAMSNELGRGGVPNQERYGNAKGRKLFGHSQAIERFFQGGGGMEAAFLKRKKTGMLLTHIKTDC